MDQNKTWDIAEHNILNKDMSKYVEYTWTHWCIRSLTTSYQPLNIGRCNSDVVVQLIKTCLCFCYLIKTCICFCYLIKTCICLCYLIKTCICFCYLIKTCICFCYLIKTCYCFCYLIKTCICLCYLIKTCICLCYLIKTCICFCSRKINYYNTISKGKSAIVKFCIMMFSAVCLLLC